MISHQRRLLSSMAEITNVTSALYTLSSVTSAEVLHCTGFCIQTLGRHKGCFFVVVLAEQRSLPRPVLKCSRAAVDVFKQSPVSSQNFVNNPECDILPRLCLFSSVLLFPSQFIPVGDRKESEKRQQSYLRLSTLTAFKTIIGNALWC